MTTTITAGAIKTGVLDPALEAIAVGDYERELIYRPDTPEVDSLFEHWQQMGRSIHAVAIANGVQMDFERAVAGFADELTRDMRAAELTGQAQVESAKKLARRLTGLLDILANPGLVTNHAPVRGELYRMFAATPAPLLFRDSVTREIGVKRIRQLRAEHARWDRDRTRQVTR